MLIGQPVCLLVSFVYSNHGTWLFCTGRLSFPFQKSFWDMLPMERYSGGIFEGCSSDVEEGVEILFCGTSWSCFAHDPMESSDGAHVMLCKMSGEMRSQGGMIHL